MKDPTVSTSARVLVLISDLQIGPHGDIDTDSDEHLTFAVELAENIKSRYKDLPGGTPVYSLFMPGDLASIALGTEYKHIEEFLLVFAGMLFMRRRDIYLCPGNHDYERPPTATYTALNSSNSRDSSKANKIIKARFRSYKDFHDGFYIHELPYVSESNKEDPSDRWIRARGRLTSRINDSRVLEETIKRLRMTRSNTKVGDRNPESIGYFHRNKDLKLDVLSYNSAYKCGEKQNADYGLFPAKSVTDMVTEDKLSTEHVRICMGHHGFDPAGETDDSPIRNPYDLRSFLRQKGFRFLFHGHQHEPAIQRWTDENHETIIIGCGSAAATKEEMPKGIPNTITCIVLDNTFATIESFPLRNKRIGRMPDKQYRVGSKTHPITSFNGRRAVSKANHDLLYAARKKVYQTFIKSGTPSNDALMKLLSKNKGISVHRVLSASSTDPTYSSQRLDFARKCLDLAKDSKLDVSASLFEPGLHSEYPFVNLLIVDDTDVIINFSRADSVESDAIYFQDEELVKLFMPFFKAYAKEPLTDRTYHRLLAEDKKLGPEGLPQEFINDFKAKFETKMLAISIVGSSIYDNLAYPARIYDVDVIIISDNIDEQLVIEIGDCALMLCDKHSTDSITLLMENRIGPFRPRPPGRDGSVVVQMHFMLTDIDGINGLPEYMIHSLKAACPDLSLRTLTNSKVLSSILCGNDWSLDKLIQYCSQSRFPFTTWGHSGGVFGKVKLDYILVEPWERLEFYGYVARITLLNLLIALEGSDFSNNYFGFKDGDLIDMVHKLSPPGSPIIGLKQMLAQRRNCRNYGTYSILSEELEDFKKLLLIFLNWAVEQIKESIASLEKD